jgi:hypothetical protein
VGKSGRRRDSFYFATEKSGGRPTFLTGRNEKWEMKNDIWKISWFH